MRATSTAVMLWLACAGAALAREYPPGHGPWTPAPARLLAKGVSSGALIVAPTIVLTLVLWLALRVARSPRARLRWRLGLSALALGVAYVLLPAIMRHDGAYLVGGVLGYVADAALLYAWWIPALPLPARRVDDPRGDALWALVAALPLLGLALGGALWARQRIPATVLAPLEDAWFAPLWLATSASAGGACYRAVLAWRLRGRG